jgi:hypothetical protein
MTNFFIGAVVGLLIGTAVNSIGWRANILDRGLAVYCPLDGKWAWKGECADE